METQRQMRETRIGNTFSNFTAIHRLWQKLHGGICRYKTFCTRVFARRTFLRFRYCSIHVKMHVLLTYSAFKRRVSICSRNLVPAVSPMSGSPLVCSRHFSLFLIGACSSRGMSREIIQKSNLPGDSGHVLLIEHFYWTN